MRRNIVGQGITMAVAGLAMFGMVGALTGSVAGAVFAGIGTVAFLATLAP